jgi:two-component system, chemotaxis family, sensor kinase Cph1
VREPSEIDLTNCDREPIHVPGAIQPHGALLALSLPSLAILQASESVARHLGLAAAEVVGRPIGGVLEAESAELVAGAIAAGSWREENPLHLRAHGADFDGILHQHDGVAILELEPAQAHATGPWPLRAPLAAIQRARTLEDLSAVAVADVKRMTGFERVMLYRFAEDDSGSVDAEAKEPWLEPYLGLRYPASDIPRQARELYRKNWLRIIPDSRYAPSPLVPALRPDTGAPLDLSFSVLRSVSPIHLEYMENMGVRASMSASLIVQDRLWGLIGCVHHGGPRRLPYEVRSAIEVMARVISLQIDALAERHAADRRVGRRGILAALVARIRRRDTDVLVSLLGGARELLELVEAAGAAALVDGEVFTCGEAPGAAAVRAIAAWIDEQGGGEFSTSELPRRFSPAMASKDVASGVLSVALPGRPRRRLLWFRPELIKTVTWGGDPRKAAEPVCGRLHPRHSFELWKEEVRLSSRPWRASDLEAATELLHLVVEVDLERQLASEQRARRVREDLMAFVSHDLRTPLSAITMAASLIRSAAARASEQRMERARAGADAILRSADRMNTLIADLLDAARIEAGHFAVRPCAERVADIVEESLTGAAHAAESKRVALRGDVRDRGTVWVDRDRLFQVLANLLGNAIKFTPEGGNVALEVERRDGEVLFTVADSGPGITEDDLPHIFDRYWHRRSGGAPGGSGLGLAIAKGIVEAHGGRIWAESVVGGGARFRVALPASGRKVDTT